MFLIKSRNLCVVVVGSYCISFFWLQELDGRPLRVNAGPPPPKREDSFSRGPRSSFGSSGSGYGGGGGGGAGSGNRVYVGNLSWGVDDMALESLFGEQGKVVEARVIYDRDSGRSKGFGFVTYNSAQEVQNAIRTLNGAVSICFSDTNNAIIQNIF